MTISLSQTTILEEEEKLKKRIKEVKEEEDWFTGSREQKEDKVELKKRKWWRGEGNIKFQLGESCHFLFTSFFFPQPRHSRGRGDGHSEVDFHGALEGLVDGPHDDICAPAHQLADHAAPHPVRPQHAPLPVRRTTTRVPEGGGGKRRLNHCLVTTGGWWERERNSFTLM